MMFIIFGGIFLCFCALAWSIYQGVRDSDKAHN